MFLEVQIYKFFSYDYHNSTQRKNKARSELHDLTSDIEIYKIFEIIDDKVHSLKKTHASIKDLPKSDIEKILLEEDQWIKSNINNLSQILYSRNSRYLFSNGDITLNLPAHYKFDELIAAKLGCSFDRKLFVPEWSNTIRIYGNSAELRYQPTGSQTKKLIDLNIKSFFYKNNHFTDIFDEIVDKMPRFTLPLDCV
jgi:hypothetical protein